MVERTVNFESSKDALDKLIQDAEPIVLADTRDGGGETVRRLAAVPSGDEVYTDKPVVVWEEKMDLKELPFGRIATVRSLYREVITKRST